MAKLSELRQTTERQQGTLGLDSAQVVALGGSGGVTVYDSLNLLPVSSLTAGDEAYVKSNNRYYISNGSGWYNAALVNAAPYWDSEPLASYDITDSATPLIITAKALDSDNPDTILVNQSSGTDSAQYLVTVTNDSSVFTFTPKSQDSIGASVTAGDLTDSSTNDFIYTFKWSDGINFVSKAVTINYNFGFTTIDAAMASISQAEKMTINFSDLGSTEVWVHPTYGALYSSHGTDNSLDATNEPAFAGNRLGKAGVNGANGFTITSSGNLYTKEKSTDTTWTPGGGTNYAITAECFGFFGSAAATAEIKVNNTGYVGPSACTEATALIATTFQAGSCGFQGNGSITYINDGGLGGTNDGVLVPVVVSINTASTRVFSVWETAAGGNSITSLNTIWVKGDS